MKAFAELGLSAPLAQALAGIGYETMTPVQAAALPPILAGRDTIVQARTGSGKTAAFALGLLSVLDVGVARMQGLVLCPTRELADQVSREVRRLAHALPNVKVLTLCGGVPLRAHLASLAHEPHIAVGTPGRLLDLMQRGALRPATIKTLVLDEADRMLDMGFADALRQVMGHLPSARQTLLFSATIPDGVRDISRKLQRDPVAVTIVDEADEVLIEQRFFEVDPVAKPVALAALLQMYRPESAVVFCNTREAVRAVAASLSAGGFSVLALHGEMDQRAREETLLRFANHSANILVASDVAARGLDIAGLAMVINFDIANDADTHLHRIGRTGRAGRRGVALTLCAPWEVSRANALEDRCGSALQWSVPPVSRGEEAPSPARFVTLMLDAGKQDKLRPGDILGALTGDAGVPASAVGKIDVFPSRSYVAIDREWRDRSLQRMQHGKIKGRKVRMRSLGS
ncbi:ATP-dependent RNA helicase DbpA [Wenzhouxiangella sp. XN24]|uniref:ATP-dependent RNA helicase DbpA n=1 Tax=Wenzhouxiangella sp. XN24 TaxID=2713569 RepID=UPI0013EDD547|nr:ATP-dependent RNA helicase DbpA [Wenzhouxiangella sp. XN24]NGX15321.1 ATP-dependent RNA helicase DbpA [Wenzhouxiangella sp. XN24]